jgi:hypothetical protein
MRKAFMVLQLDTFDEFGEGYGAGHGTGNRSYGTLEIRVFDSVPWLAGARLERKMGEAGVK